MTRQKDLKRVVRTRMQKTGESYTAARVHVVGKKKNGPATKTPSAAENRPTSVTPSDVLAAPAAATPKEPTPDYASLAGFSDEVVAAKTGCTWAKWVGHLDHWGALDKPHREIVDHVHEKFGVPGWWAQMVTVGYERIRGLRAIGQRRSGSYEMTKSKTVPVPLPQLYAAFADEAMRQRWLPGVALVVRKATADKSMRITWEDGTSIEIGFYAKGTGKSQVAIAHTKLPDRPRADELRAYWSERLDALAALLGAGVAES